MDVSIGVKDHQYSLRKSVKWQALQSPWNTVGSWSTLVWLSPFLKGRGFVLIFFSLLCWVRVHCGIYKSSYTISNTSYLNSLPPLFSFITSYPHSCIVLEDIIFPFTYMYIQYLHHIHSPMPFPHLLHPPTSTPPSSILLFSNFGKEKWYFV
jgi:hypothetical protein